MQTLVNLMVIRTPVHETLIEFKLISQSESEECVKEMRQLYPVNKDREIKYKQNYIFIEDQ